MAIRPGGRGDVTATHVEWQAPSGASYVPSIVYYDGLLYMTNEVGVVTCADARPGERVCGIGSAAYSSRRRWPATARSTSSAKPARRSCSGRADAGGAGEERPRRALHRLAGDLPRRNLPPQRPHPVRRPLTTPEWWGSASETAGGVRAYRAYGQTTCPRPVDCCRLAGGGSRLRAIEGAAPAAAGAARDSRAGPATSAPYAPQPILPGGVVVPLYPPGSPLSRPTASARPRSTT